MQMKNMTNWHLIWFDNRNNLTLKAAFKSSIQSKVSKIICRAKLFLYFFCAWHLTLLIWPITRISNSDPKDKSSVKNHVRQKRRIATFYDGFWHARFWQIVKKRDSICNVAYGITRKARFYPRYLTSKKHSWLI